MQTVLALLTTIMTITFLGTALAKPSINENFDADVKVIYGTDNRVEISDYSDRMFKDHAKSTATMINRNSLSLSSKPNHYRVRGRTLNQAMRVCKSERFSDQLAVGGCSGFLVAPNIIITAGHCARFFGQSR